MSMVRNMFDARVVLCESCFGMYRSQDPSVGATALSHGLSLKQCIRCNQTFNRTEDLSRIITEAVQGLREIHPGNALSMVKQLEFAELAIEELCERARNTPPEPRSAKPFVDAGKALGHEQAAAEPDKAPSTPVPLANEIVKH